MPWKEELPMDQKLNSSPNISVTRYLSPISADVITSLARPAINGLLAIKQKAPQHWQTVLAALSLLPIERLRLFAWPLLKRGGVTLLGALRSCSSFLKEKSLYLPGLLDGPSVRS